MTNKEETHVATLKYVLEYLTEQKMTMAEMVGILEVAKTSLILSAGGIVK